MRLNKLLRLYNISKGEWKETIEVLLMGYKESYKGTPTFPYTYGMCIILSKPPYPNLYGEYIMRDRTNGCIGRMLKNKYSGYLYPKYDGPNSVYKDESILPRIKWLEEELMIIEGKWVRGNWRWFVRELRFLLVER